MDKDCRLLTVEELQNYKGGKFFLIAGKDYYYFLIGSYGDIYTNKDACETVKTLPHKVSGCVNFH